MVYGVGVFSNPIRWLHQVYQVRPRGKSQGLSGQIVEGHKCLHRREIIYWDTESSNILLTPDLIPKISASHYCKVGYMKNPNA